MHLLEDLGLQPQIQLVLVIIVESNANQAGVSADRDHGRLAIADIEVQHCGDVVVVEDFFDLS